MSHFVGIVFGPKEEVDYKLAPYDENLEVEPYIERSPKELLEWAKDYEKNMRDTINKYSECIEDNYKQERAKELIDSLHNQWHNFESKEDYKALIEKHFNLDDKGNAIRYSTNSTLITFMGKNADGKTTEGLQIEQLALIMRDYLLKQENPDEKKIAALNTFLDQEEETTEEAAE